MIGSRLSLIGRQMMLSQRRNVHFPEGYRGANLPVDISNKRLFYLKGILFLAIPYWIPFLVVRHQLKKSSDNWIQMRHCPPCVRSQQLNM